MTILKAMKLLGAAWLLMAAAWCSYHPLHAEPGESTPGAGAPAGIAGSRQLGPAGARAGEPGPAEPEPGVAATP